MKLFLCTADVHPQVWHAPDYMQCMLPTFRLCMQCACFAGMLLCKLLHASTTNEAFNQNIVRRNLVFAPITYSSSCLQSCLEFSSKLYVWKHE